MRRSGEGEETKDGHTHRTVNEHLLRTCCRVGSKDRTVFAILTN